MNHLIPWRNTGTILDQMRNEMDEMFRRFFGTPAEAAKEGPTTITAWTPRVDVSETEKAFVVHADVPGVDPNDIEVQVNDGVLVIRGEKKEQKEDKQKNYHRVERFYGHFYRAIPLPTGVDDANIEASTVKGVLEVTIPKKPESQPKKITVKPKE